MTNTKKRVFTDDVHNENADIAKSNNRKKGEEENKEIEREVERNANSQAVKELKLLAVKGVIDRLKVLNQVVSSGSS